MSTIPRPLRAFGFDGPIAQTVVMVYRHFTASLLFVASLVPVLAFSALIGWQSTHLAVWLSSVALLPAWPGAMALVAAMRRLVIERRDDRRLVREFGITYRNAVATCWGWIIVFSAMVAVLQYDLAIVPGTAATLMVGIGAVVLLTMCIGLGATLDLLPMRSPAFARISALAAAVARRPHVALSWLLLVTLTVALVAVPTIGPSLAVFAPAAAASGIAVVNAALGFDHIISTRTGGSA